jgi:hypothetical protein
MTSSRTTTSIYIAARIRVKFYSKLLEKLPGEKNIAVVEIKNFPRKLKRNSLFESVLMRENCI